MYVIKYRSLASGRWEVHGTYSTRCGAEAVLRMLQGAGLSTFVERHGDAPFLFSGGRCA